MTIGEIIKKYCSEHGMSYQQFAQASKVSKGYISMLINGRNPRTGKPMKPTIETYINIAEAMDMTVDQLFEIMDDAPVYFFKSKANIPVPPYRGGLADRLLEGVLSEEDDQLLRELEAIRRDPERQRLFRHASHSDIDEVRQANAILDALKETKR